MSDLEITDSSVTIRCTCGESIEFDDIHDGWQHIYPCYCGKFSSPDRPAPIYYEPTDPPEDDTVLIGRTLYKRLATCLGATFERNEDFDFLNYNGMTYRCPRTAA